MSKQTPMRVLVAGAGVAAFEAVLALGALAKERVVVELIAPEPLFWYRPLAVGEPFRLGAAMHFGLPELAAAAGATFSLGTLASVDVQRRTVCTAAGASIPYDALLIACGAIPVSAVPGALTFRGPADTDKIEHLLGELAAGEVRRVVFVVPPGAVWSLPVYELALMTAAWLAARAIADVELAIVTPEEEPLQVLGRDATASIREMLAAREIAIHCSLYPREFGDGQLLVVPNGVIPADRVVALPRLGGQEIAGIPQTVDGFISVDSVGHVLGLTGVYAAGDITTFGVKQGGIAAQQAEAAAHTIAIEAGADVALLPFRPVLRGYLMTGSEPRYFHHELERGKSAASADALWWPPAKIVGRYLAPFLSVLAGTAWSGEQPTAVTAQPIDIDLGVAHDADSGHSLASLAPPLAVAEERAQADGAELTVGEIMLTEFLTVGGDDTLGGVAARMSGRGIGAAIVVDEGRLIGILTSHDLLRAFAGRVHPDEARVREWMTAEPVAVSDTTTIGTAVFLMTERSLHQLPVVDGRHPVGLVGLREAARHAEWRPGLGLGL